MLQYVFKNARQVRVGLVHRGFRTKIEGLVRERIPEIQA